MRAQGDPQRGSFRGFTFWLAPRELYVFGDALVEVRTISALKVLNPLTGLGADATSKAAYAARELSPSVGSIDMVAKIPGTRRIPFSEISAVELKVRKWLTRLKIIAGPAGTLTVHSSTGTLLRRIVLDPDEMAALLRPLLSNRLIGIQRPRGTPDDL